MGFKFYTGDMFPPEYRNSMLIAQKGSWNRETKQGYNVVRVSVDANGNATKHAFIDGFLENEKADPPMWGRPTDVLQMKDGSILVSDDYNGVVYRISYAKKAS